MSHLIFRKFSGFCNLVFLLTSPEIRKADDTNRHADQFPCKRTATIYIQQNLQKKSSVLEDVLLKMNSSPTFSLDQSMDVIAPSWPYVRRKRKILHCAKQWLYSWNVVQYVYQWFPNEIYCYFLDQHTVREPASSQRNWPLSSCFHFTRWIVPPVSPAAITVHSTLAK